MHGDTRVVVARAMLVGTLLVPPAVALGGGCFDDQLIQTCTQLVLDPGYCNAGTVGGDSCYQYFGVAEGYAGRADPKSYPCTYKEGKLTVDGICLETGVVIMSTVSCRAAKGDACPVEQ